MAPWADAVYATDFGWWAKRNGLPGYGGLKLSQDESIHLRPQWNIRKVTAVRGQDRLLLGTNGIVGWGGNSGFGALNLALQFGVQRIILVGYDMRLDRGLHWHGPHKGLNNPTPPNVDRWRRVIDRAAPVLKALGVAVINVSRVSKLQHYPKMSFEEAIA